MFHLCEKCPDIANFRNIFKISFDQNDFDDDDKINHKHWVANNWQWTNLFKLQLK